LLEEFTENLLESLWPTAEPVVAAPHLRALDGGRA
jgi:hypothetical protein